MEKPSKLGLQRYRDKIGSAGLSNSAAAAAHSSTPPLTPCPPASNLLLDPLFLKVTSHTLIPVAM
ncbi:hypothetical protein E2C01_042589 [Portunus trituberculatus]|uniref:Uncharacterized protein n=1 Tax=Portunus trituberculatus TaxID=210409 RepID=A0A5B7FTF3_PORTR|nr:hypothetical protein [Portunus trituberculatus]